MPTPLRALYCTDTYPPQLNGVSVVTALSVDGLRQRGWEVAVISPAYPPTARDVLTSGALARRLAVGARHTAEALPWEDELDRLVESYRSIICERTQSAAAAA